MSNFELVDLLLRSIPPDVITIHNFHVHVIMEEMTARILANLKRNQ